MEKYLGLKPGSVSPFGLVNDTEHHVYVFLDENLKQARKLSFHPNDNRASLAIKTEDFIRYMDQTGNGYEWIRLYWLAQCANPTSFLPPPRLSSVYICRAGVLRRE